MKNPIYSIAVDLGGTSLRVQSVDKHGHVLKKYKGSAPSPADLHVSLHKIFKSWRVSHPHCLTVGSKGIWTKKEKTRLKKKLSFLARKVTVLSDVELAYKTSGLKKGILILAGTGSIALGKNKKGRWIRAGGLGPLKGDEGSGHWIGKEYLRITKNKNNLSVAQTAAYAKQVLKKSAYDPACACIIKNAQKHLVKLVIPLAQKLQSPGAVPISFAGGLFQNKNFRLGFWKELTSSHQKINFLGIKSKKFIFSS